MSDAYYNVQDYGAVGDASTNDTVPIQAAIDDAALAGGGTVLIPKKYAVTQLLMKTKVSLVGMGWGSVIKCISTNPTTACITNADMSVVNCTLSNFFMNGNKGNQVNPVKGIYWNYLGAGAGNELHLISRVYVWNMKGVGIHQTSGTHVCNIDQFFVYGCDEQDMLIEGSDSVISHGQVANSGLQGVKISGWNNKLVAVKPFLNGKVNAALGHGFHVCGNSGDTMFSACEPQDNPGDGYFLDGCHNVSIDGGQPGDNAGSALRISGGHHHDVKFHVSGGYRTKHSSILKIENNPAKCHGHITYDQFSLNGPVTIGGPGDNNIMVSEY